MISLRMAINRRLATLCLVVMVLGVTAACGSANQSSADESVDSQAISSNKEQVAEQLAEQLERTVNDAMGETTIPATPQRVIVLNTGALESLLALGIKPIGAPYSIPENAKFFAHLAAQAEGVDNIGTVDQPNLETIAKLAPDLILAQKEENEAIYADLKRIAPVYMVSAAPHEWKTAFQGYADAVNKAEEGKQLLADFENKVAAFKGQVSNALNGKTVTLIRPRADHIRIQMPGSFSGSVAAEAGVQRPGEHHTSTANNIQLTEEQIAEMDSDIIISFGREHEAEFFNEKITKNPVWGTLAAVKNNDVYFVNWEVWLSGQGIQSAGLIIDDLTRLFVK